MARFFNGSTTSLEHAAAPVTAVPLTLAGWGQHAEAAQGGGFDHIFAVGASGETAQFAVGRTGTEAVRAQARSVAEGQDNASGTAAAYNTAWHHAAAVFASTTSRIAYLDSTASTENTATNTPLNLNQMRIGARGYTNAADRWHGPIAEVALWNVALDAAEIAILAAAYSPLFVRPANLIAYWPLWGASAVEPDLVGGYGMTVTGATSATHPRIIYPISPPRLPHIVAAAAPAGSLAPTVEISLGHSTRL